MLNSLRNVNHLIRSSPLLRNRYLRGYRNFIEWQIASRIFRTRFIVPWINHISFVVSNGETGLTGNIYVGLMEPEEMAFTLLRHRKSDLFIDVGANLGSYTLLAAGVVGSKCISFEPVPTTFSKFVDNVNFNNIGGRVKAVNAGCGQKNDHMFFTNNLDTSNYVEVNKEYLEYRRNNFTKLPVYCLDNFINKYELVEFNDIFLKVDVEGFELNVLKGASKLLMNQKLNTILVEMNNSGYRYGYTDENVHETLLNYGFLACAFDICTRSLTQLNSISHFSNNCIYVRDIELTNNILLQSTDEFYIHTIGRKL